MTGSRGDVERDDLDWADGMTRRPNVKRDPLDDLFPERPRPTTCRVRYEAKRPWGIVHPVCGASLVRGACPTHGAQP